MYNMIEKSKKNMKNRKGFTLIELIVVIVIIGILAAIVIPNLAGFSKNAQAKADIATARTLATAAASVYADDPGTAFDTGTTTAALAVYLPADFDWATQVDSAVDFFVDVTEAGDITVEAGSGGLELYPTPDETYGD